MYQLIAVSTTDAAGIALDLSHQNQPKILVENVFCSNRHKPMSPADFRNAMSDGFVPVDEFLQAIPKRKRPRPDELNFENIGPLRGGLRTMLVDIQQ